MQSITRVVCPSNHLDVLKIKGEDHLDETLVPAIDVTGNAVDQCLDPIDITFTIECPEADFARLTALASLRHLDAWHLPKQLPAVHDSLVLDFVSPEYIHGSHYATSGLINLSSTRTSSNVGLAQNNGGFSC
ncbi:hypothetical protein D9M71_488300 [compost metagenome]